MKFFKNWFKHTFTILCVLLGVALGYFLTDVYVDLMQSDKFLDNPIYIGNGQKSLLFVLFAIILAFIGFILGNYLTKLKDEMSNMDNNEKINLIFSSILGFIISILAQIALGLHLILIWNIILTFILIVISYQTSKSITDQFYSKRKKGQISEIKYLDTNVIIDGRIADIYKTGFIEGEIIIPKFILLELQIISDSGDFIKRARGKRGIEILNNIQKEMNLKVIDTPYDNIRLETDTKLMKLAKDTDAVIITNDYNLNKVATLQGIKVLNINELAMSLKPVVLPGEHIKTTIMREGKEKEQGLAYLDDGTMIVVENAIHRVGDIVNIEISSVLQTAQGKILFAKILEDLYEPKKTKTQSQH